VVVVGAVTKGGGLARAMPPQISLKKIIIKKIKYKILIYWPLPKHIFGRSPTPIKTSGTIFGWEVDSGSTTMRLMRVGIRVDSCIFFILFFFRFFLKNLTCKITL